MAHPSLQEQWEITHLEGFPLIIDWEPDLDGDICVSSASGNRELWYCSSPTGEKIYVYKLYLNFDEPYFGWESNTTLCVKILRKDIGPKILRKDIGPIEADNIDHLGLF